ncbi:DoxX family protein [Natronococcus sp. A-GB7]|uniref:DoxX family protein n=1 Tax=Natronococcus sp. A-GB7 TaxID=3037649 RepID=UPI00241E5D08|nr:DoxX family protein [Natronococcus sp. A-GB7]MDG5820603.1 DoxX family protein [Natronococcus sp. A-GB7]
MRIADLVESENSPWFVLVRLAVGFVFLTEGLNKFVNPGERGAGRFADLGFPAPELVAGSVAVLEIVGGALLLLGLLSRLAALLLAIAALHAILLTKIPVLLGTPIGPFVGVSQEFTGLWGFLYAWRLDFTMFVTSVFVLIVGPGEWSLDHRLADRPDILGRTVRALGV